MRRRSNRSTTEESADIDMTPMLDIVFIMLIFFIVTTSFVKESGIEVNRPPTLKQSTSKKQDANIIVAIKPNGAIYIDKKIVDIRVVRNEVTRLHAENPLGAVVITADKESKTKVLTQVMDQIRLAGVTKTAIATMDSE